MRHVRLDHHSQNDGVFEVGVEAADLQGMAQVRDLKTLQGQHIYVYIYIYIYIHLHIHTHIHTHTHTHTHTHIHTYISIYIYTYACP